MPVKIDMEMPNCCSECIFHLKSPSRTFDLHLCTITNRLLKRMAHYRLRRPPECPLQEVKE